MKKTAYGNVLGVIPAKLQSSRLVEKPMSLVSEKPMVQRVWEAAKASEALSDLVIATDGVPVRELAKNLGANWVMTDPGISTGLGRTAAVWEMVAQDPWDTVVSIPSNIPFLHHSLIDQCVAQLARTATNVAGVTLAAPIFNRPEFESPEAVKVVIGDLEQAIYFSRAPVPHRRDGKHSEMRLPDGTLKTFYGFRHIGITAVRPVVLKDFASSGTAVLEEFEDRDVLRLLSLGHRIEVAIISADMIESSLEVNTPAELEKANAMMGLPH